MRVGLVAMPWGALDWPSLAVGVLHTLAENDGHETTDYYGTLAFAEHVAAGTEGAVGPEEYTAVSQNLYFLHAGEWVFTSALYGTETHRLDEFVAHLKAHDVSTEPVVAMHRLAPSFVERAARDVLANDPDVVGFTTSFAQNTGALAVAKRVKELRPEVVTVFGGANCDAGMGAALHRSFPQVDVVVRGEAERTWPELLRCIEAGEPFGGVDGVCWRDEHGASVANPYRGLAVPAALWPAPDYDDYFAALEASPLEGSLDPQLVWESARGCWWGERSHCTFCGLNGGTIAFRSKPGEQVYEELAEAVARYRTPNVVMVDNIVDLAYFDTLLPRLAESDWDLRLFYETKSCLTREQVALARAAGVLEIQPGIESLSTPILDLMGKGARGPRQVALLRDCESYDVAVAWNYLYGFPGEEEAHYDEVLAQLPNLVHLQPPGVVCRLAVERFAPYFENPDLGFPETAPTDAIGLVYDLPAEELREMAYLFDAPERGVSDAYMTTFRAAVAAWQEEYAASTFTRRRVGDALHLRDRRAFREPREVVLTDPAEVAAYDLLAKDRTPRALAAALEEAGHDVNATALLERWLADGLVFGEGGRYVALATDDDPHRVRA